jgi:sugar lactone lactonase YvrE
MKKNLKLLAIIIFFTLLIIACKKDSGIITTHATQAGSIISTIAGNGTAGFTGDGGNANNSELNKPKAIAIDTFGNIYITDYVNERIRKISPSGIISTFAGTGIAGYSGDGGSAVNCQINGANGITTDISGNVYFADEGNKVIRKINLSGIITTIAGGGTSGLGDGGLAINAAFGDPTDVGVDNAGNIYVSDISQNRIRKINVVGIITTIAGNGNTGFSGNGGQAVNALLWNPTAIAVDGPGNIYISDGENNSIRKIDITGVINTIAGYSLWPSGGGGNLNNGDGGYATNAAIGYNEGVAVDAFGNVYISGYHTNRIRKINSSGIITTIAGTGTAGHTGDGGLAVYSSLNLPIGLATDSKGNIYVADMNNNCIRKISK